MIFTSRFQGLSVVIVPSGYIFDQHGQRRYRPGKRADFKEGVFGTEDKEIIEGLLNHKDLGVRFDAEKVAAAPDKVEKAKKKATKLAEKTTAKATDKVKGKDIEKKMKE